MSWAGFSQFTRGQKGSSTGIQKCKSIGLINKPTVDQLLAPPKCNKHLSSYSNELNYAMDTNGLNPTLSNIIIVLWDLLSVNLKSQSYYRPHFTSLWFVQVHTQCNTLTLNYIHDVNRPSDLLICYFYFKIQMATAEKGLTFWLHIQHATHCLTLLSSLHSRATWAEAIVYFSGSFHQERCTQLTRRDFFKASRTELNKIVIIKQKKINIAWSGGWTVIT